MQATVIGGIAYNDYLQYLQWTQDEIYFVTRQKENAVYKNISEFELSDTTSDAVLKDEAHYSRKERQNHNRRIAYWDNEKNKVYEFITNHLELEPDKISAIYKHRWQI